MRDLYPYSPKYRYPHLKPADADIWNRFMQLFPDAYDQVQYDLNCGEGAGNFSHEDPAALKSWGMLKARKIDVCGHVDGHVDIIELKPHAGPSALGQVLGYLHLYVGYVDPHADARAVLVTDGMMPDMPYLAAKMGVRIIIV